MTRDPGLAGPLNGLPMWVKAIAVVGLPSVICLYLVVTVTTFAMGETGVQGMQREMVIHSREMRAHEMAGMQRAAELKLVMEATVRALRSICLNVARDDSERLRCVGDR